MLEPAILSTGRAVYVRVGERVVLPCRVQAKGDLVRLWKQGARVIFADEMRVRRDSRYRVTEAGDLVIDGFDQSDTGTFECQLETDSDRPIFIRHSLEEARVPRVRLVPARGEVVVEEKENTTVRCEATGRPPPGLTWSRLEAGAGQLLSRGGELSLTRVSRDEAGEYRCSADNGVGPPVTASVSLVVECK